MSDEEAQTPSEKIDQKIKFYTPLQVFLVIGVVALIFLYCVIMAYSITQNRDQSQRIERQTKILIDCTTPEGECYKESNKRQSGAIQLIGEQSARAAAAATVCAKIPGNDTFDEVYACTVEEMSSK